MNTSASPHKFRAMIQLLRPGQWIKNTFVIAPLLFGHKLAEAASCRQTGWAFVAFCLAASSIYILNDFCDRQEDRLHPVKRYRPLAAGLINPALALLVSLLLFIAALAAAYEVGARLVSLTACFMLLNIAYSLFLKHLVIIDALTITGGFMLRILAGAVAAQVSPSPWLLLCTLFISLFLALTKRRAELAADHTEGCHHNRPVLRAYSLAFLDQLIAIVTAATILCYALYSADARTVRLLGTQAMLVTVPCVIYGVFRYLYLIFHLRKGEDPTGLLLKDIPTLANLALWLALCFFVVYRPDWFSNFFGAQ